VSVRDAEESPYWMYVLGPDARMQPLMAGANNAKRRQDLPAVHVLNGAVYVSRVDSLRRERAFVVPGTLGHVMPSERSIDIDLEHDLLIAEQYLTGQTK
jgi:N-acylneuraminate cytidylyltransferase